MIFQWFLSSCLMRKSCERSILSFPMRTSEMLTYGTLVSKLPHIVIRVMLCTRLLSQEGRWEVTLALALYSTSPSSRRKGGLSLIFTIISWGQKRPWQWHTFSSYGGRVKRVSMNFQFSSSLLDSLKVLWAVLEGGEAQRADFSQHLQGGADCSLLPLTSPIDTPPAANYSAATD